MIRTGSFIEPHHIHYLRTLVANHCGLTSNHYGLTTNDCGVAANDCDLYYDYGATLDLVIGFY